MASQSNWYNNSFSRTWIIPSGRRVADRDGRVARATHRIKVAAYTFFFMCRWTNT